MFALSCVTCSRAAQQIRGRVEEKQAPRTPSNPSRGEQLPRLHTSSRVTSKTFSEMMCSDLLMRREVVFGKLVSMGLRARTLYSRQLHSGGCFSGSCRGSSPS
ncbi:hypothetical protein AOLI_G00168350 [Acnodon oligacanthus]